MPFACRLCPCPEEGGRGGGVGWGEGRGNALLKSAVRSEPVMQTAAPECAESARRDSLFLSQPDCGCLRAPGAHSPATAAVRSDPHNQIHFY